MNNKRNDLIVNQTPIGAVVLAGLMLACGVSCSSETSFSGGAQPTVAKETDSTIEVTPKTDKNKSAEVENIATAPSDKPD